MNKMTIALASAVSLALVACAEPADDTATTEEDVTMADQGTAETEGTIVEVAQGNDNFSTLVAAVTSADLAETLSGACRTCSRSMRSSDRDQRSYLLSRIRVI